MIVACLHRISRFFGYSAGSRPTLQQTVFKLTFRAYRNMQPTN